MACCPTSPMVLRRRRKHDGWSWDQILGQTVACFATSFWEHEARAAIILHVDPATAPAEWAQAQAEDRTSDGSLKEYGVFCYAYSHKNDFIRVVMDGDRQATLHEIQWLVSLPDAEAFARQWLGDDAKRRPFEELPGLYQAAYHDRLTAQRWDADQTTNVWMESEDGVPDFLVVREFPQPRSPTSVTPNPAEVTAVAVPRSSAAEFFRARGW